MEGQEGALEQCSSHQSRMPHAAKCGKSGIDGRAMWLGARSVLGHFPFRAQIRQLEILAAECCKLPASTETKFRRTVPRAAGHCRP